MKVEIREALPEDAQEIGMILAQSWKAAYIGMIPQAYLDSLDGSRWKRLQKDLADGTMKAKLLLEDGVPAGAVGYGRSRDKAFADWGEVVCLYVRPGFCRRGYGEKLLRAAQDSLARAGFRNGFLWVLEENRNARDFYSAMGLHGTDDVTHSEIMGKTLAEVRYLFSLS